MFFTSKSSILCGIAAIAAAANIYFPCTAYGEGLQTVRNSTTTVNEHFVLSGVHTDQFQLVSNSEKIFDVEGCVPGDKIQAEIEAENTTDESLELALISIESELADTALFDILELTIAHDKEILYDGAYHPEQSPVTEYITVDAGETITLDISVVFPKEADNAFQGKQMKSSWLFEAKHAGMESNSHKAPDNNAAPDHSASSDDKDSQNAVKTGVDLIGSDFKYRLLVILGLICIGIGSVLILRSEKKEN